MHGSRHLRQWPWLECTACVNCCGDVYLCRAAAACCKPADQRAAQRVLFTGHLCMFTVLALCACLLVLSPDWMLRGCLQALIFACRQTLMSANLFTAEHL